MAIPVPMPGQHSAGQPRGGQYTMKQHGFHGNQQHFGSTDQFFNEQLAFFSIHKPLSAKSWDEATPVHHRLSMSDIRKALAKLHQNPRNTVKDTLMNLKSDSARRLIHALVQEQNDRLSESDPTSQWFIAGIDVKKETVKQWPSQKTIIKSIEVILKTEPALFNTEDFDDDVFDSPPLHGAHTTQAHRIPQHHGANTMHVEPQVIRAPPPGGNPPYQVQDGERGPTPMREGIPPPPHHGQPVQVHVQQPYGPAHGPQHPGGGPQQPGGGPQAAVIPPPPPPPPHSGPGVPIKQAQVVPPPFDPHQQPRTIPGAFPEPVIVPGVVNVPHLGQTEIIDPHLLRHQKSKPKGLRREYQVIYEPESESDSGNSYSSSHFSSKSVEDGAYGLIEPSRGRERKMSKTRSRSHSAHRSRSNSRHRFPKVYKVKKSHGRKRSDVEPIHEDKQYPLSSKNSSPRSSASGLPAQPIINIHIDNDNDRERERNSERGRDIHTANHNTRRNTNPLLPPHSPNPMYAKHEIFDTLPMSRHSSVGGSDTGCSFVDGNSSIYTSDDSVFSEPVRPRMHSRATSEVGGGLHLRSRNMPVPRDDTFGPTYHESRRRQKPVFPVDDYPPHRPRGSLHDDHVDRHWSSFSQRPPMSARRHSMKMPNPLDARYSVQPSRSYAEAHPSYAYTDPPPHQRYMAESRPDPFELQAMVDKLDAMPYVDHTRRGGMPSRHNSLRGRMFTEVDEWANRPHERMYNGWRHI